MNDKGFFVGIEIFQEPTEMQLHRDSSVALLRACHELLFSIIYTITGLLWAFSLVVDRHLLNDTHTDGVRSRQQTCFSFSMPQKSFNKSFAFLLHKTSR